MNDPRGSIWRKWDLHVHTPASYDYKNLGVSDEDFINTFKQNNISAVAITDHHKIDVDRYFKLKEISKDIAIFPGIELRSELGGSESVHFIGIFSDSLNQTELTSIWTRISGELKLTDSDIESKTDDKVYCSLEKSAKLIHELGGIVTIHAGGKSNSIENINSRYESFKNAIKTDIITLSVDILEVGKDEDTSDYHSIVFPAIKKTLPIILASDNHDNREYQDSRYCWIKADPTFEGLKQIINEPSDRVFIGDEPKSLVRVRNDKTKYIKSLSYEKEEESALEEKWFDNCSDIPINSGLVAVIGNKGSGKSAIADTLGLLGDTSQNTHFSFLNENKFRNKKPGNNKAKHFIAQLELESGDYLKKSLNASVESTAVEKIKCIPQNYLEKICTDELEGSLFEDEVDNVIFSHVKQEERLNCTSLEELINIHTIGKKDEIELNRNIIESLNKQIADLDNKLHPSYKEKITNLLTEKEKEKLAHEQSKPIEVVSPNNNGDENPLDNNELTNKQDELKKINKKIDRLKNYKQIYFDYYNRSKQLVEKVNNLDKQIKLFKTSFDAEAKDLGIKFENVIKFQIDSNAIKILENNNWKDYSAISEYLNDNGVIASKKQTVEKEIIKIQAALDEPNRKYQEYLKNKQDWDKKLNDIIGSKELHDTIEYYKQEIIDIDGIPTKLSSLKHDRLSKVESIYNLLIDLKQKNEELYKPVNDFIEHNPLGGGKFCMDFVASIQCVGFEDNFFKHIAQNKRGSFYGVEDGKRMLKGIIDESGFDDLVSLRAFVDKIENNLAVDIRDGQNSEKRFLSDQIRTDSSVISFYDFLYKLEYLKPQCKLKWIGKELSELSPGERGTVLLIFYLIISKDRMPLVIDQPEENLDNETVYNVLVPCIKEACKRRQVFIVTHNPNLAVVCDADQIIHCEMDKKDNINNVTYTTGAIENPGINKALINILEGTRPAFDKRDEKYYS